MTCLCCATARRQVRRTIQISKTANNCINSDPADGAWFQNAEQFATMFFNSKFYKANGSADYAENVKRS